MTDSADYIVVGGGLTGLPLAHRLSHELPNASVLVIEAGEDPRGKPDLLGFAGFAKPKAADYKEDWNFEPVGSKALKGRIIKAQSGRGVGGGSNINAGMWLRGNAVDYDLWAKEVNDDTWSYAGMLPYLKKTEDARDRSQNQDQHGFDGYLKVTQTHDGSSRAPTPLAGPLKDAWAEAGIAYIGDPNSGCHNGLSNETDVWLDGKRQLLVDVLDLSKVKIMTETLVHRVVFEQRNGSWVATGVDLGDGKIIKANKEVILSASAYASPKILMHSGIGDPEHLKAFDIPLKVANSNVGKNLSDHLAASLQWKLKHPEQGLALGSPLFKAPTGYPMDLQYHGTVANPSSLGELIKDETERRRATYPGRSQIEVFMQYLPMGPEADAMGLHPNGEYISTFSLNLTPVSKGTVKIQSGDPSAPPLIDRNFVDEEADLYVHREAMRLISRVFLGTEAGRAIFEGEAVPEGSSPVLEGSTDEELNKRIIASGVSISHPMGTCAMGPVVDTRCRVQGVEGLRVIDASVLPFPHGAPLQPLLYALAEKMAYLIAQGE